ncbi:MAG: hypothetical protein WDN28_07990 [Chthoniobacter sp.]
MLPLSALWRWAHPLKLTTIATITIITTTGMAAMPSSSGQIRE